MKLVQMTTNADGRTDTPILPKGPVCSRSTSWWFRRPEAILDAIGAGAPSHRGSLTKYRCVLAFRTTDAHYQGRFAIAFGIPPSRQLKRRLPDVT